MKPHGTHPFLGALALFSLVAVAGGEVTYIDADNTAGTGNTVLDGTGSFGPTTNNVPTANDGLWSVRGKELKDL